MTLIRSNLASRPFYNERLVTLAVILGLVLVVGLSAFNVSQVMSLSAERGVFKAAQDKDDREAATVSAAADAMRRSVDQAKLVSLARQTHEANELIDQRTFSWTVFFGHVEQTMPIDARLMEVSPRVDRGEFMISMRVNARRFDDLEDFIDHLNATGVFYDVSHTTQTTNDDGTITGTILARYYLAPTPPKTGARTGRGR